MIIAAGLTDFNFLSSPSELKWFLLFCKLLEISFTISSKYPHLSNIILHFSNRISIDLSD